MKIIIFGSNGMLGTYMVTYLSKFYEIIKIDRNILDAYVANNSSILSVLETYKSDGEQLFVINCIGIIPQRNNLDDIKKYIKINTIFPHLLANCCEILNYKLIHISTDCVFSGSKGNYSEDDSPDETNIYGLSKFLGEPDNCCIIRTSIIGEELQNKKSLLEWVKSQNGKTINGFVNHYWNGVTCLQLVKIIHHMIENNIYWHGVLHIHSPNSTNKYGLIKMIIEIYNLNIILNEYATPTVDKTVTSKYPLFMEIPTIGQQIIDQQAFACFIMR